MANITVFVIACIPSFFVAPAFITDNVTVDHVKSFTWGLGFWTTNVTASDFGLYNPWDSPRAPLEMNGTLDAILCFGRKLINFLLLDNTPACHWYMLGLLALALQFGVLPRPPPPPPPPPIPAQYLLVGVNRNFVAEMHDVPQVGLDIDRVQPED